MNLIERITRGGSIVGYSILTIVLIAASASTIYLVRERGEQVREPQVVVQETPEVEKTPIVGVIDDTVEEVPPREQETPRNSNTEEGTIETESTEDNDDLPVTGPTENLAMVLGIAALTAALVAYLQSRRDLAKL